jgi:YbgC/YbaW family acyl-CoA thioester hydrolase
LPEATVREFKTRRKIEFADTDLGGIVHFSRYLVFMETAEHEYLDALGTSVHTVVDGETIGWPRVKVACEYQSPARYGDTLDITVRVKRKGRSSITYDIQFQVDGRKIARGEATAVRCRLGPETISVAIPDELAAKIEEA